MTEMACLVHDLNTVFPGKAVCLSLCFFCGYLGRESGLTVSFQW